jgi:hypothetical protein
MTEFEQLGVFIAQRFNEIAQEVISIQLSVSEAEGQSAFDIWESQEGNLGKGEMDFLKSLTGKVGTPGTDGLDGNSHLKEFSFQVDDSGMLTISNGRFIWELPSKTVKK